jgi:ABC-type sugar transport system substrate-binding protein
LVLPLTCALGCDSAGGGSARESAEPDDAPSAPRLAMVLPRERTPENGLWEQLAPVVAGQLKVPLDVFRPAADEPPLRQAELVRAAADGGAAVVIVEPDDPRSLVPTLEELRSAGVRILLLARPVTVAAPPLPLVVAAPLRPAVERMVDIAREAAMGLGAPAEGPALIMALDRPKDRVAASRQALLAAILENKGLKRLPSVLLRSDQQSDEVVLKLLESKDRPALIFADEDNLLSSVTRAAVVNQVGDLPVFAGFVFQTKNDHVLKWGGCAAVIDLNHAGFARQTVATALAMARGEAVPDRTEVPLAVRSTQQDVRRPRRYGEQKAGGSDDRRH